MSVLALSLVAFGSAPAADDSKVKAATSQVEKGAKKIPDEVVKAGAHGSP